MNDTSLPRNRASTQSHPQIVANLIDASSMVSVVVVPDGYGLLPLTLSLAQAGQWVGLGKTKLQELVNQGELATAKVDGRTLVLTNSVLALVERNRVDRGR